MNRLKKRKVLTIILLISILAYGFVNCIQSLFHGSLKSLDHNPKSILNSLNFFSLTNEYRDHYLGWLIYYPTYLLLHMIFIYALFQEKKKIRNRVAAGLIIFVIFLVVVATVSKLTRLEIIYQISYTLFQNLFGLPFILLAIEGGKIFMNDINKMISSPKNGGQ